jgi:hypothetical protein
MKHLKLFESYSKPQFRMPEEISSEEFHKKLDNFSKVPLTNPEKEFLMSCGGERDYKRYDVRFDFHFKCLIRIFNDLSGSLLGQIEITKLDDDWYLIYEYVSPLGLRNHYNSFASVIMIEIKYYICDEWGEVLGYLSSKGFNI